MATAAPVQPQAALRATWSTTCKDVHPFCPGFKNWGMCTQAIIKIKQDAWCIDGQELYNAHGSKGMGTVEDCAKVCLSDAQCSYFGWGFDTHYNAYKCGTFSAKCLHQLNALALN